MAWTSDDGFCWRWGHVRQATLHLRDWPLLYNARNPNRNPNWWPQSVLKKRGRVKYAIFVCWNLESEDMWRWWTCRGNDVQKYCHGLIDVALIQKYLHFRKSKLLCLWDFDTSDSKSGSLRLGWFPLPWSTGSMARAQIQREIQRFWEMRIFENLW